MIVPGFPPTNSIGNRTEDNFSPALRGANQRNGITSVADGDKTTSTGRSDRVERFVRQEYFGRHSGPLSVTSNLFERLVLWKRECGREHREHGGESNKPGSSGFHWLNLRDF